MGISIKEAVATIAPFLARLLGGPLSTVVEKHISHILGKEDNESTDMLKALAKATPEQLAELKRVDADFKLKMAELGLDEAKVAALDRDSARKRETIVQNKIPAILSIFLTVGFFATLFTLILCPVQGGVQSVVQVMLGALGTSWIASITYYFGSSYGSDIKTHFLIQK